MQREKLGFILNVLGGHWRPLNKRDTDSFEFAVTHQAAG